MESCEVPRKMCDPIGSAVLTFIGYKRTHRQTDKQSIYIEENQFPQTDSGANYLFLDVKILSQISFIEFGKSSCSGYSL